MSTIKGSVTSRRSGASAGSGGKRHRNDATLRGEKITRHGCVWRKVPSAVASHLRTSFSVSRWSRHHRLQVSLLQCGCTSNLEVSCDGRCRIIHVSLSFASDVIATSQSCDTASKKRETNTSCRELELSFRQEALHLRETNAVLREHELVMQKGRLLWKSDALNFKTRLFDFRRFEVIWCLRWIR